MIFPWYVDSVTPMRLVRRGGGFQTYYYSSFSNCSSFCGIRMQPQSVWTPNPPSGVGDDLYYMKCFEALSSIPLNEIRLGFTSQVGTSGIDPALPQMNISDFDACVGI